MRTNSVMSEKDMPCKRMKLTSQCKNIIARRLQDIWGQIKRSKGSSRQILAFRTRVGTRSKVTDRSGVRPNRRRWHEGEVQSGVDRLRVLIPAKERNGSDIVFAAANRDAAALKASAWYDRTIRGIDFKVGDKVWQLDQSTKVGVNPKLRSRWRDLTYSLTSLMKLTQSWKLMVVPRN